MDLKTAFHIGKDNILKFQYCEPIVVNNTSTCSCDVRKIEELCSAYYRSLWQLAGCITPELDKTHYFRATIFIKSGVPHWRLKSNLKNMKKQCDIVIGLFSKIKELYSKLHTEENPLFPRSERYIFHATSENINIKYPEGVEKIESGNRVYDIIRVINREMNCITAFARGINNVLAIEKDMLLFNWTSLKVDTDIETFTKDLVNALSFTDRAENCIKTIRDYRDEIFENTKHEIKI